MRDNEPIPLDLEGPTQRKRDPKGRLLPKAAARKLPPPISAQISDAVFAGITPGPQGDCCNDCTTALCMITMIGFCGHPNKGALQSTLQNKPEIVARRRYAKRMLDTMMLEARKD